MKAKIPKSKFYVEGEEIDVEVPEVEVSEDTAEKHSSFYNKVVSLLNEITEDPTEEDIYKLMENLKMNLILEHKVEDEDAIRKLYPEVELLSDNKNPIEANTLQEQIFIDNVSKLLELCRDGKANIQDYINGMENSIKELEA